MVELSVGFLAVHSCSLSLPIFSWLLDTMDYFCMWRVMHARDEHSVELARNARCYTWLPATLATISLAWTILATVTYVDLIILRCSTVYLAVTLMMVYLDYGCHRIKLDLSEWVFCFCPCQKASVAYISDRRSSNDVTKMAVHLIQWIAGIRRNLNVVNHHYTSWSNMKSIFSRINCSVLKVIM